MLEKMRRGPENPNKVKKEMAEGMAEYKEGVAEFAGEQDAYEEDNNRWEKATPEVNPAESKKHLELGLEKAKEIIAEVKGDFIGARYSSDFYGYSTGQIESLVNVGEEEIIKKLALGKDWAPLYDDQMAFSGSSSGDGSHFRNFIGGKEISSSSFSQNTDTATFYYVAGEAVTPEDYETFREEVRKMLYENYQQRGAEETYSRQLPPEVKGKVEKIRFDDRTEQVLKDGAVVAPGVIKLRHIYGSSHFGSGGGYGSVNAYDLAEWREGKRVKKEVSTKDGDNGFMSGPNEATIESGTILICKGGDAIGREGRSWEEIYICE